MSLEQAIEANTAAIRDLITALTQGAKTTSVTVEAVKEITPTIVEEPAPKSEVVTYDQCAAAVTKLAKAKGRPAAVALLGEFSLKTLQDAKEDAAMLAKIKAAADAALEA